MQREGGGGQMGGGAPATPACTPVRILQTAMPAVPLPAPSPVRPGRGLTLAKLMHNRNAPPPPSAEFC